MNTQAETIETVESTNSLAEQLRGLLDMEIMLIGGGEVNTNCA
jgi:hypothetical protein